MEKIPTPLSFLCLYPLLQLQLIKKNLFFLETIPLIIASLIFVNMIPIEMQY